MPSQPSNSTSQGLLIALVGTIIWATTGIFIDYLFTHYTIAPLTLAFWRNLIIALTLIGILAVVQPTALKITRRDVPFFLVYGFVGLAVFNGLWSFSVKYNGAAVATVLAYSSPGFTVLLAPLMLGETLTWRKLGAVALSLLGCVLVVKANEAATWALNLQGILTGLGTGLAFAFYSLAGCWSAQRFASSWTVTAYGFLFASFGLALTQTPEVLFTMTEWDGWLILIILAIGPSLAGFGLYTLSLRYLPASLASLIAALEPAFTAVMAIFVLNQWLEAMQWFGAGLILAAVVVAQSGGQKPETNHQSPEQITPSPPISPE